MDEIAKALGFDDELDMMSSISDADISTPEKLNRFEEWKESDGTKQGLLEL